MNSENAKDYLPLVQALAEGKTIEFRNPQGEWKPLDEYAFAELPERYRIKPLSHALPPWANGDESVLHNPDGLTPEQVGEGWRLKLKCEGDMRKDGNGELRGSQWWRFSDGAWGWSYTGNWSFGPNECTLRPPLSIPWPDEPKPAWTPRFKVGDRVKISCWQANNIGTIKTEASPAGRLYEVVPECGPDFVLIHETNLEALPLPEPPKMVPLCQDDVPVGSHVRLRHDSWLTVLAVDAWGIYVVNRAAPKVDSLIWTRLKEDGWEILRPGSTTWQKCEKEAQP